MMMTLVENGYIVRVRETKGKENKGTTAIIAFLAGV